MVYHYEIAYHSADGTKTTNRFRMFENWFEELVILSYIRTFYNRNRSEDLAVLAFCQLRPEAVIMQ